MNSTRNLITESDVL